MSHNRPISLKDFPKRPRQIRHPSLSTLCFPCNTCGAMIDCWCKNENADGSVCASRKAMYFKAHDRYEGLVRNGTLKDTPYHPKNEKQIQDIIKEVINA